MFVQNSALTVPQPCPNRALTVPQLCPNRAPQGTIVFGLQVIAELVLYAYGGP
jgi:hypothetical protein